MRCVDEKDLIGLKRWNHSPDDISYDRYSFWLTYFQVSGLSIFTYNAIHYNMCIF